VLTVVLIIFLHVNSVSKSMRDFSHHYMYRELDRWRSRPWNQAVWMVQPSLCCRYLLSFMIECNHQVLH